MGTKKVDLLFYYSKECRYCQKVILFMTENDIAMPMKDIVAEPKAMEDLLTLTGRYTVPCLFIDGIPKYESDDIIRWLEGYINSNARKD